MADWVFTAAWIVMGLWFVVWEALALMRDDRGDTLSEHVWSWFQLKGRKDGMAWWKVLLRLGFVCFWVWLTLHFLSGGSFL
jgi:hypothetical protein